jgi:IMP cyclohydrolase
MLIAVSLNLASVNKARLYYKYTSQSFHNRQIIRQMKQVVIRAPAATNIAQMEPLVFEARNDCAS